MIFFIKTYSLEVGGILYFSLQRLSTNLDWLIGLVNHMKVDICGAREFEEFKGHKSSDFNCSLFLVRISQDV